MGVTNLQGGNLTVKPNGAYLAKLRHDLKLKQTDVEQAAGIPNPRLSMYENNRPMWIGHLELLAAFYNVDPQELVDEQSFEKNRSLFMRLAKLHKATVVYP